MKIRIMTLAALVGAAFCAAVGTAPAKAGATVLKDFPVFGQLAENDCSGEALLLAGTATIVIRDNGLHLTVKDVTATGVTTNTLWTGVGVSTQTGTTNSNANGTLSSTTTFKIQLSDGTDSFRSKLTLHTTVNANGDVTASTVLDTTVCK